MTSFIYDVLEDLKKSNVDFSKLTIILPSKRAGTFLKHELKNIVSKTNFSPIILSIEEFVEELSHLKQINNTELLFEFYKTYTSLTKKEQIEPFDSFSKWAQILIQDFNEIDRYLIPQKQIFSYLGAIQELNHWSLENTKTELIQNYLSFWNKLEEYYTTLTNLLLKKGVAYQGLIYRKAVENLESYIQANTSKQHVFIGFNALNASEEIIIQELLHSGLAKIYWDADSQFISSSNHDAGLFIRQHKTKWKYFEKNHFSWLTNHYSKKKNITTVGVPKNIGQVKYIGELVQRLQSNSNIENTAIVLGNESLLIPLLNSIPSNINALNITMGFPLKDVPLSTLFEELFALHKHAKKSFYFKEVTSVLSNEFLRPLFIYDDIDYAQKVIDNINTRNIIYVSKNELLKLTDNKISLISFLFSDWKNSPKTTIDNCISLILKLKHFYSQEKDENLLPLEYLFRFFEVFNTLKTLNSKYNYIDNIQSLFTLYKEVLSSETLDFKGEPLNGLQIMGMLESRVLDFETVIISSVNEGILPSGKSNNSFIPFDVKLENGLPTYKDKDAVYTYHFYRLIQRARNIYIIYNTETDALKGGEKSRFIRQLEVEKIHEIKHEIIVPKTPRIKQTNTCVKKDTSVINKLTEIATKGFSPSSLSTYIRNPLDFYLQKVLGIKEQDDIEETIAANTLGTVVHNTLEEFYKPFVGHFLNINELKQLKPLIDKTVLKHFNDVYHEGEISKGKNLIIFEIAKRYVQNFIDFEINTIKQGNNIKLQAVETKNEAKLIIPKLDVEVKLNGTVDRIDEYNGVLRIIDYKTGKVERSKVEIVDWEDLTTDYTKYSKSFQVLMYAYMLNQKKQFTSGVEAGIISFKNMKEGFLKFSKKPSLNSRQKDTLINEETLKNFEIELIKLITEIFNPEIDFIEKDV